MSIATRLIYEFMDTHKGVVGLNVGTAVALFAVENVIIPRILGESFNSVSDPEALRLNLYKLVGSWVVTQGMNIAVEWSNVKMERAVHHFLNVHFIHQLFIRYEQQHKHVPPSIILDKFHLIEETLEFIFYRVCVTMIPRFLSILLILWNIYTIQPKFGIVTFGVVFLLMLVLYNVLEENRDISIDSLSYHDHMVEKMDDMLTNMEVIHSTPGAKEKEEEASNERIQQENDKKTEVAKRILLLHNTMYVGNIILFSVLLYYLYDLYKKKELPSDKVGTLILSVLPLFTTMSELVYYVPDLIRQWDIIKFHNDFLEELFDTHHIQYNSELQIDSGEIVFSHSSFSYGKRPIFTDFSITIPSGSFVTLQGASGSGKSTFIKLVLGHEKLQEGEIFISGHNITDISPMLRKQSIAYLHQHTTLFDTTLYENLIYGLEDTPELRERIRKMITMYEIGTVYTTKEDDFSYLEQPVGKGGSNLSGGQRQLLQLMRCLLHPSPRIIILDEPTSAVDVYHTQHVLRMIHDVHQQGKTILLISHDPPPVSQLLRFSHDANPKWES
jgi:ABC-type multidrug transport system fused ATPase/permease subunit